MICIFSKRCSTTSKKFIDSTSHNISRSNCLCLYYSAKNFSSESYGAYDKLQIGHLSKSSHFLMVGGTAVHTAVCIKKTYDSNESIEPVELSLPLTVEYKLKSHALGKLPNYSNKRERHGSEKEILLSRIVDRSVRPLFSKYYVNDIQITSTVHSIDNNHDPVVNAVNGASLALLKADIGWLGPIGCVRVGLINGELILNPNLNDLEKSDLDLLYSATQDKIVMIETSANQISESILEKAIRFAQTHVEIIIQNQIKYINDYRSANNISEQSNDTNSYVYDISPELLSQAESIGQDLALNFFKLGEPMRTKRSVIENQMRNNLLKILSENELLKNKPSKLLLNAVTDHVVQKAFRNAILSGGYRADGRKMNEIRHIECRPGIINGSLHGSAFFKRGDTHVLSTITLGSRKDGIELDVDKYQHFFLHYDFPPYCTGTIGNATSTNRRMIGHGNLAEKALIPLIPKFDHFPYTIRAMSECTSSSGSSSMGSVCSASLALIDAGVPIKNIAAGLSIGLVTDSTDDTKYALLTDIIGTGTSYA